MQFTQEQKSIIETDGPILGVGAFEGSGKLSTTRKHKIQLNSDLEMYLGR